MATEKRYSPEEFLEATLSDVVAGAEIKAVSKSGNEYSGIFLRVTDDESKIVIHEASATTPRRLLVERLDHIIVLS